MIKILGQPAHIPEGHPEAICERCGRKNVVWFAPNELWNKVARRTAGPEPMLCPVCFIKEAEALGLGGSAWRIQPEFYAQPNSNLGQVG